MKYYSPLRYPGGKAKLTPYVRQIFIDNNLCDGVYIEPYAGGAGVGLEMVMTGYAREAWLNDIDPAIHSFWDSVFNQSDELIQRILTVPLTIEEWHRQKNIYNNPDDSNLFDLGFATLFLNRTNRSGILTAGVIGGFDQKGKWLIDARFNRESLANRIRRISQYSHRFKLFNLDAEVLLNDIAIPEKSLIYFDPPYFRKAERLYRNHYVLEDHARLAELIQRQVRTNWIVSYDNADEIAQLYSPRRQIFYSLKYSANTKKSGAELMVFSDSLQIPQCNNPARYREFTE